MKSGFVLNIVLQAIAALFAILPASVAFGQAADVVKQWVDEHDLTQEELLNVRRYFPDQESMDLKYAKLSFDASAVEFMMTLPDGSEIKLINTRKKSYGPQAMSWRGTTADGKGSGTITVNNGMITASISSVNNTEWTIRPISKNRHVIYRSRQVKSRSEESPEDYQKMIDGAFKAQYDGPRNREPGESNNQRMPADDCYIRILVGYESGINEVDPVGFAIQCVELSNTIYAQSQINFEAELAFAKIYPDNASSDIDDALFDWEYSVDDKFNDVFSDREQYDADFCILIVNDFDGEYVGLAATILASYNSAFCVVEHGSAVDNLSFTHEIGHLMGARHDEYMDGSGDYNHGYILHSEKVRTVMAYNDECDDNGYYCDRIKYFSNPDITYDNTGKPLGTTSTAHNERALDENESEFADFEPVVSDKAFLFPETIQGEMYASVTAINTISNESTYEITGGATVVWSAGDWIQMEDGFFVQEGSNFEAKLAGCNANRMEDENASSASSTFESEIAVEVFPNPAMNTAQISLHLNQDSKVQILLKDMAGRLLQEVLPSQSLTAGIHEVQVNLANLSSGVYLIEAVSDGGHSIRKLTVEK